MEKYCTFHTTKQYIQNIGERSHHQNSRNILTVNNICSVTEFRQNTVAITTKLRAHPFRYNENSI